MLELEPASVELQNSVKWFEHVECNDHPLWPVGQVLYNNGVGHRLHKHHCSL